MKNLCSRKPSIQAHWFEPSLNGSGAKTYKGHQLLSRRAHVYSLAQFTLLDFIFLSLSAKFIEETKVGKLALKWQPSHQLITAARAMMGYCKMETLQHNEDFTACINNCALVPYSTRTRAIFPIS